MELPFDKILSYVDLKFRIKFRIVSKHWLNLIDNLQVTSLAISKTSEHSAYFYGIDQPIQNHLRTSDFSSVFNQFNNRNLASLTSLIVYNLDLCNKSSIFCKKINLLLQLEELKIKHVDANYNKFKLRLPELRSLSIENIKIKQLVLDAPKLIKLKIRFEDNLFDLKFVRSIAVERIEFDKFNRCLLDKGIRRLRYLYCDQMSAIDENFLSNFNDLKEFYFNCTSKEGRVASKVLNNLLNEKKQFKLSRLKIYYNGVQVKNLSNFKQYFDNFKESDSRILDNDLIEIYLKNDKSKLADQMPFIFAINYTHIEPNLHNLGIDFFKKLINLQQITTVRRINDEKQFLNFLRNHPNLINLGILSSQSQQFFNLLPLCCPKLKDLIISSRYVNISNKIVPTDLKFLLKMNNLVSLRCNLDFDDNFIREVFKNLTKMEFLMFLYDDHFEEIETNSKHQFVLTRHEQSFDDLDSAIDYLRIFSARKRTFDLFIEEFISHLLIIRRF